MSASAAMSVMTTACRRRREPGANARSMRARLEPDTRVAAPSQSDESRQAVGHDNAGFCR